MLPFDDLLPVLLDALWSLSALVIGLVALTGLLLQRARALEVVVGTLRAELGVAALASGTALTLWGLEEMSPLRYVPLSGTAVLMLAALVSQALGGSDASRGAIILVGSALVGALLSLATAGSPLVSILVLLALGAGLLGAAILVQRRIVDTGWDPAPHRQITGTVEVVEKSGGAHRKGRSRPRRRDPA